MGMNQKEIFGTFLFLLLANLGTAKTVHFYHDTVIRLRLEQQS